MKQLLQLHFRPVLFCATLTATAFLVTILHGYLNRHRVVECSGYCFVVDTWSGKSWVARGQ